MTILPQDIITDVLSRLPVQSVVRFRCVCKSWLSLISESQFVKKHLNRAITDVSVGCQRVLLSSSPPKSIDYEELLQNNGDSACTVLDLPTSGPDYPSAFFGSCDGMVCIIVGPKTRNKIIICNPCTRDFRELPELSEITLNYDILLYGLGYDSSTDDYKVVIAIRAAIVDGRGISYSSEVQVEVFSLRSNSWRQLPDIHGSIFGFESCGAFLNGALHWLLIRETLDRVILSFELATETFHELLPLPPDQFDNNSLYRFNVFGAYLSLDCYKHGKHDILVMKEYGMVASWTKLFTICDDSVECVFDYYYLRPVCFSKSGEVLVDVSGVQLILYNPKEETSRELYNSSSSNQDWVQTVVYVESLVSPNMAQ